MNTYRTGLNNLPNWIIVFIFKNLRTKVRAGNILDDERNVLAGVCNVIGERRIDITLNYHN